MATKKAKKASTTPRPSAARASVDDPMIPLIRTAGRQIDAEPGGRLGWLLRFVREDPSRWLHGNREAHGHRLLAMMYGTTLLDSLVAFERPVSPVAPADVDAMHAQLGAFFRALVSEDWPRVLVPTDGLEEHIVRATAPGEKPAIFGLMRRGPLPTMVLQAAKTLVTEGGGNRLLACKECGGPFLALRKRLFCSQPCLQKYYDARRPKKGGAR